jgi:SprT-like protein
VARQLTFSDITDQRTLTERADTTTDDTPETPTALLDRAQQHAVDVAAEHFPDLPVEAIDWEVSHRAQRQSGVTRYNPATEAITIALTWTAYEQHGWEQFSETVHHELVHAWQYHEFGDADHGATFTQWTDRLNTSQHCERFTTPKWWLVCEDCGGRSARYRRSKTVRNPEQYSCSECGGPLRVEEGDGH